MLQGIPRSARCVQRFDDSLNSAIHITYRISLRSSSMREPRDPLLKLCIFIRRVASITFELHQLSLYNGRRKPISPQTKGKKICLRLTSAQGCVDEGGGVHMPLQASYNQTPRSFDNDP